MVFRGIELLSLRGGANFRVHPKLALGPYAQLSAGRYTSVSLSTSVETASRDIGGKSPRMVEAGIRGTFDVRGRP
jgi:hypothetical protein